jgi:Holliday junction resolvase RusA-like endonuclease
MELQLPYQPSINHYWRRVGPRTLISRTGRAFRAEVIAILQRRGLPKLLGPLGVEIDLHPPDRRRRDVDNAMKSLLDALQHGGVYGDDSQIDDLHIRRRECVPGGCVRVRLKRHVDEQSPNDPAKPRTCLKCGRWFHSTGPAHRICSPCRAKNDRMGLSERDLRPQRGAKRHNGELLSSELEGYR